jgi:hypothetical protein
VVSECRFVLPDRRKCRCAALRNQKFCRHHLPHAKAAPTLQPKDRPYSRVLRWRELGQSVATLALEDIPYEILDILSSLLEDGDGGISDRQAGRLLRGLLRRVGEIPAMP